jgi:hypothetical protein
VDPKKAVEGHRAAVREHIAKFFDYPLKQDKDFALKTVKRVQGEIADVRARARTIVESWEDSWEPTDGDPREDADATSPERSTGEPSYQEPAYQEPEPEFGSQQGNGEEAPEVEPPEVEAP